jgi:PAS domain S-box-containing protein
VPAKRRLRPAAARRGSPARGAHAGRGKAASRGKVSRRGETSPRQDRSPEPRPAREDLWRQLFEQVPEPAFITDASGRMLLANASAGRLLESHECPLDGRPAEDLVVERDRPRVREVISRMRESRRSLLETEVDLRRARRQSVSAAATLVGLRGEGRRLRAIGWLLRRVGQPRPLTERLQRTRQEASDLRLALDQAAALLGFDANGRVYEVNERCCRLLGRPREAILGCTVDDLALGAEAQSRLSDIRESLARGDVWGGEVPVVRPDGERCWLHCTVVPLLDSEGQPSHYLAMLQDVTERRVISERLVEQEGLARLGAMAAVVAHEVRNPLAAARGALDVIGSRIPSPGDRRILADVSERLSKLNDLVTDILLYARPRPPALAETGLAELVDAAVRDMKRDPWGEALDYQFVGPDHPLRLSLDTGAIQRVVLNLLRNAAQAMEGRGRIEIVVEEDAQWCRVRVRDHGPGIPEDQREKIFEPFYTTRHKGSGLGLATARRTVQLHRGRLWLAPAPGGGTEAVVELPKASSALSGPEL